MLARQSPPLSSRAGPLALVVVLHIAIGYLVASSFGVVPGPRILPLQTTFIETQTEESEPIPVVKPEIQQPELEVPEPETAPEVVYEEPVIAATTNSESTPSEPTSAPTQELRTANRVEPVYPAVSRRLGEEGTVQLRILVDEKGRPQQVTVGQSSGFARLDQAAVEAVKRWRFQPASSGSGPVTAWTQVNITFRLEDAQRRAG